MTMESQKGISTKIFVGVHINSEVKMHLNYSPIWKQDQVIKSESGETLDAVSFQAKDFVGVSTNGTRLDLEGLGKLENYVRQCLARYCPKLDVDKFQMYIFPQLFLS